MMNKDIFLEYILMMGLEQASKRYVSRIKYEDVFKKNLIVHHICTSFQVGGHLKLHIFKK